MFAPETPEIYLLPGEWQVVSTPAILKTVLGSCVGITFCAPRAGVGAMCHPMLPHHKPHSQRNPASIGHYVDSIIGELARKLDKLGVCRSEVEVKLFGGADVLTTARKGATVGKMNADTAIRVLAEEGFRLVASHLGGSRGIFVEFHTVSGEVLLRRLNYIEPASIAQT